MGYNKEKIHSLLVEKITGYISVEDDTELERTIRENEEVRTLWQQMVEKHAIGGKRFMDTLDEELAWGKIKSKVVGETKQNLITFNYKGWLSVAAVLVFMMTVSYYFFNKQQSEKSTSTLTNIQDNTIELKLADGRSIQLNDNGFVDIGDAKLNMANGKLNYQSDNSSLEWNTISVPFMMDYKVVLSDGTEVWLNSTSNLRFPFNFIGDKREVFLEGEAYFKVAENIDKPFIVHVGESDIKVLGTSFNINSYGTDIITSLVEGSVLNSAGNKSVLLKPGYQSIYKPLTGFEEGKFDAERVLSWMEGIYYFEDVPLENISNVLWRWFKVKLIIDNPAIYHLTFTGAIEKDKPINLFMQNLEITAGIKTLLKDNKLHLK